jgi:hypothetical protein
VATVAGGLAVLATAVLLALPYLEVADDHPEAERTKETLVRASGPPAMYLSAPPDNTVWGGATSAMRERLTSVPEQSLFPGVAIVLLAIACLALRWYGRGWRIGLALGALLCAWLALGFHSDGWPWPYELLYDYAPGWDSSRTPGRLNTLTSLALALLAGGGAAALAARTRHAGVLGALLVAVVLFEGSGFGAPQPTVPKSPIAFGSLAAPQLHLPMSVEGNRRYQLWSADGFPDMVNGRASFIPTFTSELARDVEGFPDRASVDRLRELGVRTVVVHDGEPKPVEGLGLRRERRGAVVVYHVLPAP